MNTDGRQYRLDSRTEEHKYIDVETGTQTGSLNGFNTAYTGHTRHTGTTGNVTLNFVAVSVPIFPREYVSVADDGYSRIIRILRGQRGRWRSKEGKGGERGRGRRRTDRKKEVNEGTQG